MKSQANHIMLDEFARRIFFNCTERDTEYIFFLGAGCSVSSGIPGAGELVRNFWLPQLHKIMDPSITFNDWIKSFIINYDSSKSSIYYGKVFEKLFQTSSERQLIIEELCDLKLPSVGYAILGLLAKQCTSTNIGRSPFNTILTTNFDDLITDGMFIYSNIKPRVISHELLARYIREDPRRPLVVKLHGDAHLSPFSTEEETKLFNPIIQNKVAELFSNKGVIFIGYGGNDVSVHNLLNSIDKITPIKDIYWINSHFPNNAIGTWLSSKKANYVNFNDFDEVMITLFHAFQLDHMDRNQLSKYTKNYFTYFNDIILKYNQPSMDALNGNDIVVQKALQYAFKKVGAQWTRFYEAQKLESVDPVRAIELYIDCIKKFPNHAIFYSHLANLYYLQKHNLDTARNLFQSALSIDPDDPDALSWYARFLVEIDDKPDEAIKYYERSLLIDSEHAQTLGNYAIVLADYKNEYNKAEEYYKKSINSNPDNSVHLANYANFLFKYRSDVRLARKFFGRAIRADPKNQFALCNYGNLIINTDNDPDRAKNWYNQALHIDPNHTNSLFNLAQLEWLYFENNTRADQLFQRAIKLSPNDDRYQTAYDYFLKNST
jgi:protein O-mannosyl-transferase